ncbi:MAG: uracil-DNA glycosylase [Magnetococcales bacterium]|nr:uracil-DNA glycosylase [Magnetococcales bacterium]
MDNAPRVPRALQYLEILEQRRKMIALPHVSLLTKFVETLRREQPDVKFPYFDPMDGGVDADMLFLFEKPGPMAASAKNGRKAGSGFISRDNDDATAEATFRFMEQAGIDRKRTILWNVIPGWNGTIKTKKTERDEGVEKAKELILKLDKLKVIILVGRTAQAAEHSLMEWLDKNHPDRLKRLNVCPSWHPSPIVRARWKEEKWAVIPFQWRDALPD